MAEVTYICGCAGMGKTMLAEALKNYLLTKRTGYPRVKIIDGFFEEKDLAGKIKGSALSGDWDSVIVAWPAGAPEDFPVKPIRIIRIDRG